MFSFKEVHGILDYVRPICEEQSDFVNRRNIQHQVYVYHVRYLSELQCSPFTADTHH